jgi:hypothetical protein
MGNLPRLKTACLLDGFLPEVDPVVGQDPRATGHAILFHDTRRGRGLQPFLKILDELLVLERVQRHEISPAAELANEIFCRKTDERCMGRRFDLEEGR